MRGGVAMPWGNGLTARYPNTPPPPSSGDISHLFDVSTQELAFWLWRVNRLNVAVDLTAQKGVDVITDNSSYQTERGSWNGTTWNVGPFLDEKEVMEGDVYGTSFSGSPTSPSGVSLSYNYVRYRTSVTPLRWRLDVGFDITVVFPILDSESAFTRGAGSVSLRETDATLILEGTDIVTGQSFHQETVLYQEITDTATWTGTVTITPYRWFEWKDLAGNPLYDSVTGALI